MSRLSNKQTMKAQPLPGKYLEMLAEININTSFAEYCEETEKLSWLRYYKYDNKVQPSSLSGPLKTPSFVPTSLAGNDIDLLETMFNLMTLQYKVEKQQYINTIEAKILIGKIETESTYLKNYPEFTKAHAVVQTRFLH